MTLQADNTYTGTTTVADGDPGPGVGYVAQQHRRFANDRRASRRHARRHRTQAAACSGSPPARRSRATARWTGSSNRWPVRSCRPGPAAGVITYTAGVTLGGSNVFEIIGLTGPGLAVTTSMFVDGRGHDQLGRHAQPDRQPSVRPDRPKASSFVIIDNQDSTAVSGTFANAPGQRRRDHGQRPHLPRLLHGRRRQRRDAGLRPHADHGLRRRHQRLDRRQRGLPVTDADFGTTGNQPA